MSAETNPESSNVSRCSVCGLMAGEPEATEGVRWARCSSCPQWIAHQDAYARHSDVGQDDGTDESVTFGRDPVSDSDSAPPTAAPPPRAVSSESRPTREVLPSDTLFVVGRFHVKRFLGRGGFGKVYLAQDTVLDRLVALKLPNDPPDPNDAKARKRFFREPKAAAKLRHPNIVAVFDSGCEDGQYFIAVDYVNGQTLRDRIDGSEGRIEVRQAAAWVRDLARALHYAHEEGLIHRDVKPANVLIETSSGRPMLMDFGLAMRRDAELSLSMQSEAFAGTIGYMSPEQARNEMNQITARSDVYSLGVVLYEMLAGERPFPSGLAFAKLQANEPAPALRSKRPDLPRDLTAICHKAIEPEASRRYESAEAFAEDLDRYLNNEPVQARMATPWERLAKWSKRQPATAMLTMAVFLALALGVIATGLALGSALRGWSQAEKETELGKLLLYDAQMNLAQAAWEGNQIARLLDILDGQLPQYQKGIDRRGFEWFYWRRLALFSHQTLRGHKSSVISVTFSPDGKRLASASRDGTIKLWDATTGQE